MTGEIATDTEVLERLVSPAGQDVLDVGCGSGALVRELAARGAHATGLEISERQLASAREHESEGLGGYLVGRAESLPLGSASVDLVIFMRSLHHVAIDQMTNALREARRVLRPAGAVYVAEPLPEGSFFALISLVEDELEVRGAAQDALGRADDAGLRRVTTQDYAVEVCLGGVDTFRSLVVGVSPDRSPVFDARRREITAAFDRLGDPGPKPGERCFRQPMRADVLRPAAVSSQSAA